jgi:uncharacterized membrane protein HdeD (DUF308 family)
MPAVLNPQQSTQNKITEKTATQRACITLGSILIMMGLAGVLIPGLMRMHLSMLHNLVHILSGVFAISFGLSTSRKAFNYCLIAGAFYGLLGIFGFLVGSPGYPTVGNLEADQNLVNIIPNFLEFGTMDHILHFLIGGFLLFTAYSFRKEKDARAQKT